MRDSLVNLAERCRLGCLSKARFTGGCRILALAFLEFEIPVIERDNTPRIQLPLNDLQGRIRIVGVEGLPRRGDVARQGNARFFHDQHDLSEVCRPSSPADLVDDVLSRGHAAQAAVGGCQRDESIAGFHVRTDFVLDRERSPEQRFVHDNHGSITRGVESIPDRPCQRVEIGGHTAEEHHLFAVEHLGSSSS